MTEFAHKPVMLNEVLEYLSPRDNEVYVDGTLGGAGYSMAILKNANCKVVGIDRDPVAREHAAQLHENLQVVAGCFGNVKDLVEHQVDGFILDLGVSSVQLDTPDRGFSFRHDGPLDMRMDPVSVGPNAAFFVNQMGEEKLADIIYQYGEERKSRRIAAKIVQERKLEPITTTFRLADIVRSVVPKSPKDKNDPATRTFQALRIAVNDELGELKRALDASVHILKPGGRLVVVSFHSLEDGIVKDFLRKKSGGVSKGSRYVPDPQVEQEDPLFKILSKKAVSANDEEVAENSRARSAKLRAAIRTDAPASFEGECHV